jgi:hypothetical protein
VSLKQIEVGPYREGCAIESCRYEVRPGLKNLSFSEVGPDSKVRNRVFEGGW